MNKIISYSLCLILCISSACEKDSRILNKDYPYLLLDEVTEITTTGVTVNAEVISTESYDVVDFGFVLGKNPKPDLTDRMISLSPYQSSPDKITYRIEDGLKIYVLYYIRAYVKTGNLVVYSNERSFFSQGSLSP